MRLMQRDRVANWAGAAPHVGESTTAAKGPCRARKLASARLGTKSVGFVGNTPKDRSQADTVIGSK